MVKGFQNILKPIHSHSHSELTILRLSQQHVQFHSSFERTILKFELAMNFESFLRYIKHFFRIFP